MRVINNRGENREKPKGIEQRETERDERNCGYERSCWHRHQNCNIVFVGCFQNKGHQQGKYSSFNYVGHSSVERWTHCASSETQFRIKELTHWQ